MIRGLIFDINGTVMDILTNEYYEDAYRVLSNFLAYQGISLSSEEIRNLYFEINKRHRRESGEEYPEFKVEAVFQEIIEKFATDFTHALPTERQKSLPAMLADVFRSACRFQLKPYEGVINVLKELRQQYSTIGALSDGQSIWAHAELYSTGLAEYFNPIMISSDFGFRKPDRRFFQAMLSNMKLNANEVLFIGNDMYRDIFGANRIGIKTIFFKSNQGEQRDTGATPDYVVYKFSEIPEAIRFLTK